MLIMLQLNHRFQQLYKKKGRQKGGKKGPINLAYLGGLASLAERIQLALQSLMQKISLMELSNLPYPNRQQKVHIVYFFAN